MQTLLILSSLITFASCRYYITYPNQNTTWQIGSYVTITWIITPNGPPAKQLEVDLIAGPINNAQWVATICSDLPPNATSCTWPAVPSYLPYLATGYGIKISYGDGPPADADYSSRFQIAGTFQSTSLPREPAPTACIANCYNGIINDSPELTPAPAVDPRLASYARKDDFWNNFGSSSLIATLLTLLFLN